jgi:hypothetical protein
MRVRLGIVFLFIVIVGFVSFGLGAYIGFAGARNIFVSDALEVWANDMSTRIVSFER